MDPNAALRRLFAALVDSVHPRSVELDEIEELAKGLLEWIGKGGFEPDWKLLCTSFLRGLFYGDCRNQTPQLKEENRMLTIDRIKVKFTEPGGMERGFFVQATARVSYQKAVAGRRLEWLSSGGIGEVEGETGYLREIALEQLEDLREHLAEFGVDLSNFEELAKEALK